jgi:hypothetical protein
MAIMALWSGQDGLVSQVTRMMSSRGKSAGRAAALVLDMGADFTASASSAVLAVSSSTFSVAETAWHSIDLLDLSVTRTTGRVTTDDGSIIAKWGNSPLGRATARCHEQEALELWHNSATFIGISTPAPQMLASKISAVRQLLNVIAEGE